MGTPKNHEIVGYIPQKVSQSLYFDDAVNGLVVSEVGESNSVNTPSGNSQEGMLLMPKDINGSAQDIEQA